MTGSKPKQWPKWITWAEYWYNTNYHSSLRTTPFEALYGRALPVLIRGDVHHSIVEEVSRLTAERNDMVRELLEQLVKARDRMRAQANKPRRAMEYQVGDMVYLKIQPYKMKSLAKRINQNPSPRYYGPYEIEERIGPVAYKLKLPVDSKVHPVFHASLLKKSVAPTVTFQPLPACMNEEWLLEAEQEFAKEIRRNDKNEWEVLVKWKGLPDFENSWELAEKLKTEFPEFLLKDKESLEREGIDKFGKGKR